MYTLRPPITDTFSLVFFVNVIVVFVPLVDTAFTAACNVSYLVVPIIATLVVVTHLALYVTSSVITVVLGSALVLASFTSIYHPSNS